MKIQPRFAASQWVCSRAVGPHEPRKFLYKTGQQSMTYQWLLKDPERVGVPKTATIISTDGLPGDSRHLRASYRCGILVVTGAEKALPLLDQIALANRSAPLIIKTHPMPCMTPRSQPPEVVRPPSFSRQIQSAWGRIQALSSLSLDPMLFLLVLKKRWFTPRKRVKNA